MSIEGPDAEIVDILHIPCNTVIFRWKHRPHRGEKAKSEYFVALNGKPAHPGDNIWCLTCCEYVRERTMWPDGGWAQRP